MINVNVIRNGENKICGVKIENHGDPIVCSAVSILFLNTANSIEMFTSASFEVECAPNGGDAILTVSEFDSEGKAELLMESLILGFKSIEESYKKDIIVYD
ncbi:MAG: ribosomal-processing cysteine protease Prp [Clostridia bacterium]|nr:ribosomal-processing cysteine protease Prp [Clostridia bacterium]